MENQWKQWQTLFSWAPKSLQMVTTVMQLKTLAPWKKSYSKPRQHITKQRHYFADKVLHSQSYDFFCCCFCCFLVVMYRCKIWTIKKDDNWRIDTFELWCWGRLFGVPWASRRPNQSILKEISPEYSEGLMLKLQYFGHLMWRTGLIGKDSDAGKDWWQEKGMTEDEMAGWHHWFNGHEFE